MLTEAPVIVVAAASAVATTTRPIVERQRRDDDCGAAVLAMLLQAAGIETSVRKLEHFATQRSNNGAEGLTMGDLRRMVAATKSGLFLEAKWPTEQALIEQVRSTPSIVLVYEQGGRRGGETAALGHYLLVEGWSSTRGFLVSDPAVGRRGFIQGRDLLTSAHQRRRNGSLQILALHLSQRGSPIPASSAVTGQEERSLRDITELRRLQSGLSPGQTVVTLALRHGRMRETSRGEEPVSLRSRSTSAGMTIQYGLDHQQTLSLSAGWAQAGGTIRIPGSGTLSFRDAAIGPVQVGYTRQVNLFDLENASTSFSAGAAFSRHAKPLGASLGLGTQVQQGMTGFIGGLDFSIAPVGPDLNAAATLSGGVAQALGRRTNIGLALSFTVASDRPAESSLLLFGSVHISGSMELGMYASQGIGRPDGSRSREVGLTLTRALPNLFR